MHKKALSCTLCWLLGVCSQATLMYTVRWLTVGEAFLISVLFYLPVLWLGHRKGGA